MCIWLNKIPTLHGPMVTQDWSIFLDSSLNLSARSWKPEAKRAENFQKVLKAMGLV